MPGPIGEQYPDIFIPVSGQAGDISLFPVGVILTPALFSPVDASLSSPVPGLFVETEPATRYVPVPKQAGSSVYNVL